MGGFFGSMDGLMLTNKRLLEEVLAHTDARFSSAAEEAVDRDNELREKLVSEITKNYSVVAENNRDALSKINDTCGDIRKAMCEGYADIHYNVDKRLDLLSKQVAGLDKTLAEVQRENAVIMESLRVIFTNMLLNDAGEAVTSALQPVKGKKQNKQVR